MSIKTRHQLFGPVAGVPHNKAIYKTFNLLIQRGNDVPKRKTRKHFHACGSFD
jgi:hypothetical protein